MRVLVVGGGSREHALVWRAVQSPLVSDTYCAPGNAGTGLMAHNVPISASDVAALAAFAYANRIDLTIVGPETPLIAGIGDAFRARGLTIFGPDAAGARLEGSKAWAKELLQKYGIPCARSVTFSDPVAAKAYVEALAPPIVVKADGEAAGKGVVVAQSRAEAVDAIADMMQRRIFGPSGDLVVVEEFLSGLEVSALAFVDGETVVPMVPACDYKRVGDGDSGPNTGGMGSYSPPAIMDEAMRERVRRTILEPSAAALKAEGITYRGVLYAGLMLTEDGPKVLEFNARFGDPETQVILPRLKTDLVEVALFVARGDLSDLAVEWDDGATCGVVLAAGGYPAAFPKGLPVEGLDTLDDGVLPFHGGTALVNGRVVTAGGRVVTLVAHGKSLAEARAKVYANVDKVRFAGRHFRTDIAAREVRA
ncbi:MAG: phosphoribosylamine--glycine ligase [Chloroflexota bacterium]